MRKGEGRTYCEYGWTREMRHECWVDVSRTHLFLAPLQRVVQIVDNHHIIVIVNAITVVVRT